VGNQPDGGYDEFSCPGIVGNIESSRKPVDTLFIGRDGGYSNCIGLGIGKARALVEKCSLFRREEMDLGKLFLAVKCGYSDATSGIAGNPVIGYVFDRICDAGGTAMFSETTEVIGAETIVAERFADPVEKERFLACVRKVEAEAKATGQDIRSINPIPANIEAGLTTLEEKSLGAIAKAGTKPIMQCVRYGEAPTHAGLNYMDSWMSSSALFAGFAAAGAVLNIFQLGGGSLPDKCMMPVADTGVVAPILFATGNPRAYERGQMEIDFNSGVVISEKAGIEETGEKLLQLIRTIASGKLTKGETLAVAEPVELYLQGPCL
jgi:altronate dehydratase large subunit